MRSFVCLCLLFLALHVRASEPDYVYKAAAQICKPYFLKCRENPDKEISSCFQDTYYTCIPKFRDVFQSIERCAAEAGEDLQSVERCSEGFTQA